MDVQFPERVVLKEWLLKGQLSKIKELRRNLVGELLAQGEDGYHVSLSLSTFNEELIKAVFAYFAEQNPWLGQTTFLEFGSGARSEQVLNSDQDNGLLLPDDFAQDPLELEEITNQIVITLDGCGLALCTGKVMISEPEWRGTAQEWQKRIVYWLENPQERGGWQSGLILDFKPLAGPSQNAIGLREKVIKVIKKRPIIFRLLVEEMLQYKVPLSFWGGFILEKKGEIKALNLKKSILAHIINAARLLCLKYDFLPSNTICRLKWLTEQKHIDSKLGKDLIDLWQWAQLKRLQQGFEQKKDVNYLNPYLLPKDEQKILKKRLRSLESFLDLVCASVSYGL